MGGAVGAVRFAFWSFSWASARAAQVAAGQFQPQRSSQARGAAWPAELALSARSAIASTPFRDGVMVLLGRAGVSLEFTAGADRELGVGPSGVQVTSGSRGKVAGGGGTDPLCAGVAGATTSASAWVRAVRPGVTLRTAMAPDGGSMGVVARSVGVVGGSIEALLGSAAPPLPISANPSRPMVMRTGRAAGKRRVQGQVAAVCTLPRVRGHKHLLQPLGRSLR